jgi:prolyl oligopeptidase
MKRSFRSVRLALAGIVLSSAGLGAAPEYPATPVREVVHAYGNVRLPDPFAWLEERTDETEAWFRAQDAFARQRIGEMPGRQELFNRIREIDEAKTVQVYSFDRVGDRYFYLRREIGEEVGRLFHRDGIAGEERLLVDPAQFGRSGGVYAIEYYTPSLDGDLVAVGIAAGGSEIPDLYLVDVATAQARDTVIPRVRSGPGWLEDGSGFFYTQQRPEDPDEDPAERYTRRPAKLHRLGSDPAGDPVVISHDERPLPGLDPVAMPFVFQAPGTPYLFAVLVHGVDRARTVFFARDADLSDPASIDWHPLTDRDDSIEGLALHNDTLFLLSTRAAPRGKILYGDLRDFDKARMRVLLPEGKRVLTGMTVLGGRLYLTAMYGGIDEIMTVDAGNPASGFEPIELPLIGRVTLLANDWREPDVYLSLTSWQRAPAYYRYDPVDGSVTQSPLRPLGPYDSPEGLIVERVLVPSHDGVEVPLTIMYHESTPRDGSSPAILSGYGAYGISQRPAFGPTRLAWLERGGVFAVAHVRGGGEFGKEWHRGGHIATKRNSWLDFHACAEYLIEHGYSSAGRIGAMGGSMGGVLVGRAMTSRPELYGAVVSQVGNHNPVRNHRRANGPANYPEYGNPLDPEVFPYVLAMDSYFAVRDGVRYPPMLLTSGYNDARVDPWMPGKMAARLQQADPEGGPFLMRVEFDAGHGGVARSDIWEEIADVYTFLFRALQPQ